MCSGCELRTVQCAAGASYVQSNVQRVRGRHRFSEVADFAVDVLDRGFGTRAGEAALSAWCGRSCGFGVDSLCGLFVLLRVSRGGVCGFGCFVDSLYCLVVLLLFSGAATFFQLGQRACVVYIAGCVPQHVTWRSAKATIGLWVPEGQPDASGGHGILLFI